ncbi:MAG: heparinase II/III family protein [Novosphingobium sp.]
MADAAFSTRAASHVDLPVDGPAIPLGKSDEAGLVNDAAPLPPPQGEVVEPGRALALADFAPPAVGAGERLLRLAYRLGIPASTLASPFRKPAKPRLLATVANPLPGNRIAGTALRAGHFLVHGVKSPIAQIDFAGAARMAPPLERVVHSFAWLADLEASAPRETVVLVAERVLGQWLAANPKMPSRPGKGPAWSVANAGARELNWLVHAPLILSGNDKVQRARILAALNDTARWLDKNVGRAEDLLAQVVGWCGIVAAGLLLPDGKPRRLFGEAGLIRALGELVGDDGGVLSRSPLAQIEAITTLVKLRACYQAVRRDPPHALETILALLVPPLLALTHGDGSLGSWQGAWAIDSADLSALIAASGVRTRPLRDVRQWGYQRVVAQKGILQFDAAPPPLAKHARSGCASTLAFEFSHAGQRLVVGCGGAACAGRLIPVRLEQALRATAAHSTLVLDDVNSTAILINGRIGSGVSEVEVDRRTLSGDKLGNSTRLEASHNGYAARYGLTHRRILILRDDGTELRGEDLLVPTGGKGKRGKVGFAIRFHLGVGIDVGLSEDGQGAGLALPDGSYWQFRAGGEGQVSIEESIWADGSGRPQPIQQLVVSGLVSRGGGNFAWLLKKMG